MKFGFRKIIKIEDRNNYYENLITITKIGFQVEKIEASVQIAEIQDRMRSNKFSKKRLFYGIFLHFRFLFSSNKFNFVGLRNRQNPDNSIGSREISNSNRYRNQSNWRSAQDKFQSDVVYEGFRPKCVSVSTTNKGYTEFNDVWKINFIISLISSY